MLNVTCLKRLLHINAFTLKNITFRKAHCLCAQKYYQQNVYVRLHSTQTDHKRQKVVIETTAPKIVLDNARLGNIKDVNISRIDLWKVRIDPYVKLMRLNKPIGIYLLYWPCAWSIALGVAGSGVPMTEAVKLMLLFGTGAVFMRGAGCTANDLIDRDIDRQVERTKDRPLVSGAVSSKQALAFLAVQLSASFAILLQLNWYSVALGASSLALVFTYPLAKRFTNYPQVVLGATFNWGALLGSSAARGCLGPEAMPLYLAAIGWTVLYDTIYAHQDKLDDARLGIKSTALTFGEHTKPALYSVGACSMGLFATTGFICDLSWPYYAAVMAASAHAFNQIYTLNTDNPDDCAKKFKSNNWIGFLIFAGIVAGSLDNYEKTKKKLEDQKIENEKGLFSSEVVNK